MDWMGGGGDGDGAAPRDQMGKGTATPSRAVYKAGIRSCSAGLLSHHTSPRTALTQCSLELLDCPAARAGPRLVAVPARFNQKPTHLPAHVLTASQDLEAEVRPQVGKLVACGVV